MAYILLILLLAQIVSFGMIVLLFYSMFGEYPGKRPAIRWRTLLPAMAFLGTIGYAVYALVSHYEFSPTDWSVFHFLFMTTGGWIITAAITNIVTFVFYLIITGHLTEGFRSP